jgi:hypothetical protein
MTVHEESKADPPTPARSSEKLDAQELRQENAIADTEWFFDPLEKSDEPVLRDLRDDLARIARRPDPLRERWYEVEAAALAAIPEIIKALGN